MNWVYFLYFVSFILGIVWKEKDFNIYEKIIYKFITSIIYLTFVIYFVRIIFQHKDVENSASAMAPENADTIFLTAIDQVICEVLKLNIDLVKKKQCLSDDKIFP